MYTALVRTGYTTSINLFFWILYISDISDPFIFPQTLNIQTDGGKKSLTFIPLAPACVVSTNISLSTNLSLSLSLSPFSFCILCYLPTDSDSPRIPKEEFSHEQRYWSQKYALCRRKWCLQMAIHSPELADLKRLCIDHVFYQFVWSWNWNFAVLQVIRVLTPVYAAHLPYNPLRWRVFGILLLSAMTYVMLASLKMMIGLALRKHATWYVNRCRKRKHHLHSD